MQFGLLHLRIVRTAMPASNDRAALPDIDGRKANVPVGWTVEIFGITLSHIIALGLLVLATASSAGALLALVLAGCHLCPTSLAGSDGRCNTIWYKAVFKRWCL